MRNALIDEPPQIKVTQSEDRFRLKALVRLPDVSSGSWQAALSAVIEETDGTKSCWSLAHPAGEPDFHHPDCFTLELPPPNAT
ncbi:MAG: hypothetical protein LC634_11120 [Sphingomonadales bacterium]|nr:hypothetical protein [Sphingomonadales bacterium]